MGVSGIYLAIGRTTQAIHISWHSEAYFFAAPC
jgi:hypothetical protein